MRRHGEKPRAAEFGQTVLNALSDPRLFAEHFQPPESWAAWTTVLRVLFGLPLSPEDLELFKRCTGRTKGFAEPLTEAWLLCGRRSGKSRVLAFIAVVLACFRNYRGLVSAGERVIIMVLAVDRDQASVIFGYARALITETPMLAPLLEHETAETLDLTNGVSIEVHTSSYKSVRGRTLAAALGDEIAFWKSDDSRNPGTAVLAALRPSLGSIPDALLLCASSTYDRTGPAYEAFERHHGDDASDVMVWRAPTALMNPTFRQSVIDKAYAADPLSAAAEYDSEWRTDLAAFLDAETVAANTATGRRMLEKAPGCRYVAFCDPSGGRHDAFTLAIAHPEERSDCERVVLDVLEIARAPFDPEVVIRNLSELLARYELTEVHGDRYAGEFTPSAFARYGVTYVPSEHSRSELYLELLPLLMQGKVELLDLPQLKKELIQLERRTHSGGRDSVDHPKGGSDDASNSAAGAIVLAASGPAPMNISDSVFDEIASFMAHDWNTPFPSAPRPAPPRAAPKDDSPAARYAELQELQENSPLPPPTGPRHIA
jgi:hypothetical protein